MSKSRALLLFPKILLLLLILLAIILRLYKVTAPVADHHAWRQADTAAVARNFVQDEFNIFQPKIDNMAIKRAGYEINTQRYFLAEFPLYNAVIAGVYTLFGVHETYARLVTIAAVVGTMYYLYSLLRFLFGEVEALAAAAWYAIIPYSIFYGRVILPEPTMVFFTVAAIYYVLKGLVDSKRNLIIVGAILYALAILVKPYALYIMPAFLYLFFYQHGFAILKKHILYLFIVISVMPIIFWRVYINTIPQGVPEFLWLLNQSKIRFTGAFFHWIFVRRFDELILTSYGIPLVIIGLLIKPHKTVGWFFHVWLCCLLLYTIVIATGNVTHDYYQIIFLPILVAFMGIGTGAILRWEGSQFTKRISYCYIIVAVLSVMAFGWYQIRGFYNIQSGVDLAGEYIKQNTDKDVKIITGVTADTTLLYNTNRHGWTIGYGTPYELTPNTIEYLRSQGAGYYVTTRIEDLPIKETLLGGYLLERYPIEKQTDQYVIINILEPKKI